MEDAQLFIDETLRGALATTDSNGAPYVVPLHIFLDRENDALVWFSREDTIHSKNITARPEVSVTFWGGTPSSATYIQSVASRLDEEAQDAAKRLVEKRLGEFPGIFNGAVAYSAPLGLLDSEKSTEKRWYFYT